jgi:hypothetical protein
VGTYIFYLQDDRYSAPNLDIITAPDEEAAIESALARLAASPHHLSIEIWQDDRLVTRIIHPGEIR